MESFLKNIIKDVYKMRIHAAKNTSAENAVFGRNIDHKDIDEPKFTNGHSGEKEVC